MTKEELSKLLWINREISIEKRRLEELKAAAKDCTAKITGLPHVSGASRRMENISILIAEQRDLVDLKIKQSVIEYNRLNRYISGIEDPLIRSILKLRFIDGFSWLQVAMRVGGDNTADSVRKSCDRYLNSH
ncbi:hypothetical protein KQI82_12440 [Oscillibacter sp. MSJ-2]|uniref:Uncharacterized protein n=1 Tax=Dysosmobacter acutus TaxID=2841504 RepID=A0ABS6FCC9_9FIRM|nr:hypothetical protein [Dysosmobacter acutus]MBU5627718.1 hypothetical protein [Dysosmobacter acutus]